MNQTRQRIEADIAAAQVRADALLSEAIGTEGDARLAAIEAHDAAEREVGQLWRRLGLECDCEVVVPLGLGFDPAPDVSGATLLPDEYSAFLRWADE